MAEFKANRGNLMQHFVLCELLSRLQRIFGASCPLHYVDGYAMAPYSTPEDAYQQTRHQFLNAANNLPGANSIYEIALHALSPNRGLPYPSSALFVNQVWQSPLTMTLCEVDADKAGEITQWLAARLRTNELQSATVHRRPWQEGLSLGEYNDSACLLQFDPNRFECEERLAGRDSATMYPRDCRNLIRMTDGIHGPLTLMISSYSSNNNNPPSRVERVISSILQGAGFQRGWVVQPDGQMTSLVYTRGFEWGNDVHHVQEQFENWLGQISREAEVCPATAKTK